MDEMFVTNGDINIRVQVSGNGPVLLCVHGWPELAHSWRHQVAYFADRGYQVAAMDVRGYGGSSAPPEVERYTLAELASDVAAVTKALSDEPVVLFGHDWGSPIVYQTAIRHPECVRAVAGLSVRYSPPLGIGLVDLFDQLYDGRFFYFLHFQEPGVAEDEFGQDLRAALKKVYFAWSGEAGPEGSVPDGPRSAGLLELLPEPPPGPLSWLPDEDLDVYLEAFERAGLRTAFNRYRASPLDVASGDGATSLELEQPACFIAGARDMVRRMVPGADTFADPGSNCADFRGATIIDGVGHWVQQEAPDKVNAALEEFLSGLDADTENATA